MTMPLLLKTFRDHWRGLLGWGIGLVAMSSIQLSVYPTVRSSAAGLASFIENYPETLRQIFRMNDYTSGPGYLSTELFSFMVPLIFISIGASWGGNATALEEERRTADLLLTLPVSRANIIITKVSAALFAQLILATVLASSLLIGVRFVDLSISTPRIIAGCFTCVLLGVLFHSIAILFGAISGKKSLALGGTIALAISGFVLYSLAPLVHTFDRITPINPFQWTLGSQPLTRGISLGYSVTSVLVSLAIYILSISLFSKRDISA